MDFKLVLDKLLTAFEKAHIRYALIDEYFSLFGLQKIMKELREKYHAS